MDEDYKITIATMAILGLATVVIVSMAVFILWHENANAQKVISQQDMFLTGVMILEDLTGQQGVPENWLEYNDVPKIGLLTNYQPDRAKLKRLTNMTREEFGRYYMIEGLDFEFKLEHVNGSVIIEGGNEIGNSSVKVPYRFEDDTDLVIYLWKI